MRIPGFQLRLDRDGDSWSVSCGGEFDVAAASHFDEAIELCLESNPVSLLVDCREVIFIDSAGLWALLRAARRCHEVGVAHSLVESEQMRSVLTRAGLLERLLVGAGIPSAAQG